MTASSIADTGRREVGKPHAETTSCPSWCTARHENGPRPHSGRDLGSTWGALPVRLYQPDDDSARPGVMLAGDLLDEAAAHELGLALIRAADTLRRARQQAEQAVTA